MKREEKEIRDRRVGGKQPKKQMKKPTTDISRESRGQGRRKKRQRESNKGK